MKFLIISQGTRGDVQPFIALALRLESRGHEVILGAPSWAADFVNGYNIRHASLSNIEKDLMADEAVRVGFESNYRGFRGKKLIFDVIRRYRIVSETIINELSCFVDCDADIVVHHATLPAHQIAERIGARSVPVCLEPSYVSTKEFPDPMIPFRLPRWLNSTSYLLARKWGQILFRDISEWRARTLNLPHRRGHRNPFRQPNGNPSHVLQAFSKELLPPAVSYPRWVHTTGFWFLPEQQVYQGLESLEEFVQNNGKPVLLGFGSLASSDPKKRENIIADAIDEAQVPAVVIGGSGGIALSAENPKILYLKEAPYDWLLPRMAAIVHHGGSGTSGFALAAGRPQVVCPAVYGQSFNADRLYRIGVATKPIPHRDLTSKSLAGAIKTAVSDTNLHAAAKRVAIKIQAEPGVNMAAELLESSVDK